MSCAPWLLRTRRGGDSAAAAGVVARVRRGLGRRSTNNIADLLNGKEEEQEKEEQEKEKKQQYHRIGSLLPNGPDTTTATTTACSSARVVQQHQQQGVDELRQQKQGLDQRQNPSQEVVEEDSTAVVNRDCTLRAGGSPEAENKETRCNDGDGGDGGCLLFHSSSRQQLKEQQQRDTLRNGSYINTNQCSNSSASRSSSSSNDRRSSTSSSSSSSSNRQVGAAGGTTSRLQGRPSCAAVEVGGEQISSNNSSRRRSLSSVEEGGDEVAAALSAAARTTTAAAANKLASHDAQVASTDTAAAATITEKRVSNAIYSSSSRYQVGSGKKQSDSIFTSHESGASKGAPEVYYVLPREERRSLDMAGRVSLSRRDRSFPTVVSQHGHTHAAESLSSFEVSDASSEETAALPAVTERRQQQCISSSSSRAAVVETRSTREAANNSITATAAGRRTFGAVGGGNKNASPCSSGRGRGGAEEEEYEYGKESRIVSARGGSSHYSRHSELTGKRHTTGVGGRVTERWSSLFLRSRGSTLADDKAPSVLPMSEIDWIIVDRLSRKTNSSNFATVLKAYLIIKTRVAAQRANKEYTQSQRKGQHAGATFKNLLLRHRQNNRVALRVRPAATEASSSSTTAAVRGGHDSAAAAAAVVADAVTTVEAVSRVEAAAANREREERRRNRRRGSASEKRTGGGSDSCPTRCHKNGSKEEIDEEHITADDDIEALSGEVGSIIGGGMIAESCDISLSSASLTHAAVTTTSMFPSGDITAAAATGGGDVISTTTAAAATTKAPATKAEATTGGPSFSSSSCARGYPRLKGVGDVGRMQAHLSLLEQRLAFLGLCSVHIKGDGNCLFRSCSYNLYGNEDYHFYVRMHATRHMRSSEYRKEYSIFFENDREFEIYLKNMQKSGTWGDELCVRAIADAFSCTIHIITSTDSNWYLRYDSAQTIDSHRDHEYNDIQETNRRAAGQCTTVELPQDSFRDTKKHIFLTYISPIHYNAFTIAEADRSDISSN